jgi:hypothetical protein
MENLYIEDLNMICLNVVLAACHSYRRCRRPGLDATFE